MAMGIIIKPWRLAPESSPSGAYTSTHDTGESAYIIVTRLSSSNVSPYRPDSTVSFVLGRYITCMSSRVGA